MPKPLGDEAVLLETKGGITMRYLSLLVLLVALLISAQISTARSEKQKGAVLYVKVQSENFRAEPNGQKLGVLNQGTPVTVLESKGDWVKVSVQGWIWKASTTSDLVSLSKAITQGTGAHGGRLTYTVVDEKIYDKPIKTQIEQRIVVSGVPTKAELEADILKRYRAAKARRGFRYHNPATNIYIYVYGTKQQARAGQGLWIGMVAMGLSDKGEPRVLINEERLAALSQAPEERFGLPEQERKKVFREIAAAEDRATREAMARVSDSQFRKQIELERKLEEKYTAEVARKYNLTEDQLLKISVEGVEKGWPAP
jgi:hypothetical protein